jgi:acylphosphatase
LVLHEIARQVHYSGRVQGVGFRYTAHRIAKRHEVTGYVRNLDDGRVQLVAVGPPDEVAAFLAEIASTMESNITQVDVEELTVGERYPSFDIVA